MKFLRQSITMLAICLSLSLVFSYGAQPQVQMFSTEDMHLSCNKTCTDPDSGVTIVYGWGGSTCKFGLDLCLPLTCNITCRDLILYSHGSD